MVSFIPQQKLKILSETPYYLLFTIIAFLFAGKFHFFMQCRTITEFNKPVHAKAAMHRIHVNNAYIKALMRKT